MKFSKTLASVCAAAVAVSSFAVSAFATGASCADLGDGVELGAWGSQWCQSYDETILNDDFSKYEVVVVATSSGAYDADNNIAIKIYQLSGGADDLTFEGTAGMTDIEVKFDMSLLGKNDWGGVNFQVQAGHLPITLKSVTIEEKATEPDDNTGDNETPDDNTGDNETPGDTEDPAEPGDTEKPAEPGDSDKPAEPGDSDKPAEPGDSDKPTEPGDDDNNKPGDTTKPAEPDDPIVNPDDNNKPADDDNNKPADDNKNPASPDTGVTAAVLPAALAAASLAVAGIVLKKRK